MVATEILKTRVTPEMKARVAEITQAELLTEAVWLSRPALSSRGEGDALRTLGRLRGFTCG